MSNSPSFSEWLEEKYLDWQLQSGGRQTMAAFANWLSISPPLLSHYMNGVRQPSLETTHLLAEKLGQEIFDVLGLQRPDPILQRLIAKWELLGPEDQQQMMLYLKNILENRENNRDGEDQ